MSDEEFLERLRIVFERFRQLNITLNPKKCYFGLAEVEFVGHVLKSDGVCFFTKKRTEVLDFAFDSETEQLKSFLGLVNYFRDHVQGIPHKVKPLNDIMIPYKRACLLTGHLDWSNASGTYRSQWLIPQTLLRRLEPPHSRTHRCLRYGIGG